VTGARGAVSPDWIAGLPASLAAPGILVAHRRIGEDGERALLPEEAALLRGALAGERRESGAARVAARDLLARFGHGGAPIGRAPSGAPLWPQGLVGSLAHDGRDAVAALARARDFAGVGIDIEPDEDLPAEMVDLVATEAERARYAPGFLRCRILFAAKEAVFKAVHPLDGLFLDFHDIEVDLDRGRALVRGGRVVEVGAKAFGSVVALAFIRA
jgi:4'-phosphopantetheinyl transferase EntD